MAGYLLQQRNALLQFESDIRAGKSSESLRPISKPDIESYFPPGETRGKWVNGSAEALQNDYDQLLATMEKARHDRGYVSVNNFCIEATAWQWKKSKNKTRDWPLMLKAAVLEKRLVAHYRPALLAKSKAGGLLRDGIADLMSTQMKVVGTLAVGSSGHVGTEPVAQWKYPDGVKVAALVDKSKLETFDMEAFAVQADARSRRGEATRAVQAIVSKVDKLRFARVDLDKTSGVAAEVRAAEKELIRALSVNYAVLDKVRRQQKDGEEDVAIDPKWYKQLDTAANLFDIEFAEGEVSTGLLSRTMHNQSCRRPGMRARTTPKRMCPRSVRRHPARPLRGRRRRDNSPRRR